VALVEKCICHHRRQKAMEEARAAGLELAPDDYVPACVEICPAGAMFFGDLDDPDGPLAGLVDDRRSERLMEELGTSPKVFYLRPHGGPR
jgi:molybdopterin-containing oxidoreductase family iron-sulfur binding subunit